VLGICFSIFGNLLIAVSLNLQKLAHTKLSQTQYHCNDADSLCRNSSHYLKSPWWWAGTMLMTVGECGNFIAYGLAPVYIVSPLGIVTIISNTTIAPFVFKEPIKSNELLGTMFAAMGVLFVILSSLKVNREISPEPAPEIDPLDYISSIIFSITYLLYLLATLVLIRKDLSYHNIPASLKNQYVLLNLFLVAIFGSHTAISTKCLSTILSFSRDYRSIFSNFLVYYLLINLLSTALLQVKHLNDSLRVESSSKIVPLHFVCFTITVLICSTILFKDYKDKSIYQYLLFLLGCLLTFFGVFLIS
ncbi:DUF803-domain-containing protein, partial [Ascoidea rubescens DSM 1968]